MHFIVRRFIELLRSYKTFDVTCTRYQDHYEMHLTHLPATVRAKLRALTYATPTEIYDAERNIYISAKYPVFIPGTGDDLCCDFSPSDYAKKINLIEEVVRHSHNLQRTSHLV